LALGLGQFHEDLRRLFPTYEGGTAREQTAIMEEYFSELMQKHEGNIEDALSEYHLGATNYRRDRFSRTNQAYVASAEKWIQKGLR